MSRNNIAALRGCDCDDDKKKRDCDCDVTDYNIVYKDTVLHAGVEVLQLTKIDTTNLPAEIINAICPHPTCCNVEVVVCNELIISNLCGGVEVRDSCDPNMCLLRAPPLTT